MSQTTSPHGAQGPSGSGLSRQPGEPTGWLDLARVAAIGAVLMVHESGAALGSRGPAEPAGPAWWAALVLDAASRWCVPVFLMVSGALLLDPRRAESPGTFYRRRLTRIGLPLVVWTAVYLLFGHYYLDRPLATRFLPYLAYFAAWHWLVAAAGSVAITLVLRRLPLPHRLVQDSTIRPTRVRA